MVKKNKPLINVVVWTSLTGDPSHCLQIRQTVFREMSKLLDILLQRNDSEIPWGFQVRGGLDHGTYPVISSVTFGTLAAQHLNAGDKILEIEKQRGDSLLQSEIECLLRRNHSKLQLLVEKLPSSVQSLKNCVSVPSKSKNPIVTKSSKSYEVISEQEWVKEKQKNANGTKQSTKIWLRKSNRNPSLGEYDLEVNFERTKYREKGEPEGVEDSKKDFCSNRNQERMQMMSENFEKIFREKIGEWLEENMLNGSMGRQQSNINPAGDGPQSAQAPPPPPPAFPGTLPGRRIKSEISERGLEPPSVIQNAMMTKDKKPFTYTPGGIDLSEIRSPKMQRRINRNAYADEMPGIPAPTTNQSSSAAPSTNAHFSAMQSQLPAQVLPPIGVAPPPPPPPPSNSAEGTITPSPQASAPPGPSSAPVSKPAGGRPPLGFDPNELLARVNKSQPYVPIASSREEPVRNFKPQPTEEKYSFEPKQHKSNEIGQNIHVPLQNEPGHIYVPQVTPKIQNEAPNTYVSPQANPPSRGQLGSIYIPPVANVSQEQSAPSSSSPYGFKAQQNLPSVASPSVEAKSQAPWVTVYRTPQSSVPWASREPESPKSGSTRIIPIQIEGRDPPKPASPNPQPQTTPPPFLQSQQMRQVLQQQPLRQQPATQSQPSNTRVIPIQIEESSQPATNQQSRSLGQAFNQNKFNPMTPQSPTPFSPSQEKDQKPQWAPVQPRPFKKESEMSQQRQQQINDINRSQQIQPEYGTYNTAGVPLSQLRKMHLSDDDRALMDKFKSQVERQGNEILNDENSNPRYRGGYIPSRVFKALDDSVDDEKYLHNESDPRYRGACIPSKAFRMLQCMTDTAGDMPQQVPKSPSRNPAGRPLSGTQIQPEPSMGPYVPPSEQKAQEPRKYTGGSIPSRSFRMLQQMTGQEVSASSGPLSGRETPVSGLNRWCPSPSPSPVDPFWGFYRSDPYLIYNYISDFNTAYGFPLPPLLPSFVQPPLFHPSYQQVYQSYSSDNDEQGYSSTDELAQYYANYRRKFDYSPYAPNPERYSTPNSFNVTRVCLTPVQSVKKKDQLEKDNSVNKPKEERETRIAVQTEMRAKSKSEEETSDELESDTEVELEEGQNIITTNNLQALKSVSNIQVYTSESSSTVQEDHREEEEDDDDVDDEDDEDDVSLTEEELEAKEEPVPHQLSVIYEESEHSDVESIKRQEHNRSCTISKSESCSTLDNGDDDSDNDVLDAESSVTVRLPLKLKFSRSDNNEGITTVIVGDSQVERDTMYNLNVTKEAEKEKEESYDSDDADVSVTVTLPSRSNSVTSAEYSHSDKKDDLTDEKKIKKILEQPETETKITVRLPISKPPELEEHDKATAEKPAVCESPPAEDDSSSTSVQSGDTVLKHKEDTDEDSEDEKPKTDNFQSWFERESDKDCKESKKTEDIDQEDETTLNDNTYKANAGKLEEMISSLLETAKGTMTSSMEISEKDMETTKPDLSTLLIKKESQEESEEDDSGVTSDMSIKQMNSETDADTESDYSELSKMTKFQRASTHSRLFKLLQEECERCGNEIEDEGKVSSADVRDVKNFEENLSLRKQKLTLPLNPIFSSEADSLSSSSGIASPLSPTISDRLVKELIHSLLNKKKGKKFRKLPLAKLYAAALKILQEEMDSYDTSPTSGDDGLYLSPMQKKQLHSKLTAKFVDLDRTEPQYLEPVPESIYGENYYDYLDYYNTWGNPEMYSLEDYDIVPSRAFRMLREQTCSPMPIEGFKARCPRVSSKKNIQEASSTGRKTPIVPSQLDNDSHYERMTFAQKQEEVSKVLEKSGKS